MSKKSLFDLEGISDFDHIETTGDTSLGDELDLGLDEDITEAIRETDGVDPVECPILSEQIELMILAAEVYISLIQGHDLDSEELKNHFAVIETIQRSQMFNIIELMAAINQTEEN